MAAVAALLTGFYNPNSDWTVTLTGLTDSSGNLATDHTGAHPYAVMLSVWSSYWYNLPAIVAAAGMVYSGTPGLFTYTVSGTLLPRGGALFAEVSVSGISGTPLHMTFPAKMTPVY